MSVVMGVRCCTCAALGSILGIETVVSEARRLTISIEWMHGHPQSEVFTWDPHAARPMPTNKDEGATLFCACE